MNNDAPLEISISKDYLVISIGLDRLKHTAEHDDGNPHFEVIDTRQLAVDVRRAMLDEREDGSNILSDLFDLAVNDAFDNGSTAFDHNKKVEPL